MTEIPLNATAATAVPTNRFRIAAELGASIALAVAFFARWPTDVMLDDGAIALRYMDNFAKGYFYTYNVADGPVFGLSGFVHGLLAGAFAYTHVLSPLHSLFASNFIGLALVGFFLFRVLAFYVPDWRAAALAWAALVLSAPNFTAGVKQGLETPLHLAILLACVWAFLGGRRRLMWALGALAIVSKLDAVPIVAVLGLALIAPEIGNLRAAVWAHARDALLFCAVPLLAWAAFCFAVFGSPVPQSLTAKLFLRRSSGPMFPGFLEPLLAGPELTVLLLALGTSVGCVVLFVRRRRAAELPAALACGLTALAYLTAYVLFNAAERQPWHYADPEFLLRVQVASGAAALCGAVSARWRDVVGAASACVVLFVSAGSVIELCATRFTGTACSKANASP